MSGGMDGGGSEPIVGTERGDVILGRSTDDDIQALGGDDIVDGGGGADRIDGGAGFDLADFRRETEAVRLTLAGGDSAAVQVGDRLRGALRNVEAVFGGAGADVLTGDALANLFRGGAGNDVLNGGTGSDTADYGDKAAPVTVTLNGANLVAVRVGGVIEDTLRYIENVWGGAGNDTLTGDAMANLFRGGDGADTLDGAAGADVADYRDKSAAVRVTLNGAAAAAVQVGGAVEDTLRNIEGVYGGAGGDKLTGDGSANVLFGFDGADTLAGGGGKDVLDGGEGRDVAEYADTVAGVTVALNVAANVTAYVGGVAEDTLRNIENVYGGKGGDKLTGDAQANVLLGRDGSDVLQGRGGADILDGGAGRDAAEYADKAAGVMVVLNGATNAVVTVGGVAEDTIRGVENVYGGTGNDRLTGDGLANVLLGRGGDDVLAGRVGADILDGGEGTDTADFSGRSGGVLVTLDGPINAIVVVGGVAEGSLRNMENIVGGDGADRLTGDGLANVLDGAEGADTLRGGAGADSLSGGAGDDVLAGEDGADLLDGGEGVDIADYRGAEAAVSVRLSASEPAAAWHDGVEDRLHGVEGVYGGYGNDELSGDESPNILGGGWGADMLTGGVGPDRFVFLGAEPGLGEHDRIVDFQSGEDVIDLAAIDANITTPETDDAFVFVGEQEVLSGMAGELALQWAPWLNAYLLVGDIDGDGAADFYIETPGIVAAADLVL